MAFDIHIQPIPENTTHGYRVFTFGFKAALVITGYQFLINRWMKTFFTPKGSELLHPGDGTTLALLIGGNVGSQEDARDLAIRAVEETNEQVKAQDAEGGFSAEESLDSAVITRMEPYSGGGISIWVTITNLAGKQLEVFLMDYATR